MSEITVRAYDERDAQSVGRLIADTFGEINLAYAPPEERQLLLGPFRHAYSPDPAHQAAIAETVRADMAFVAEDEGQIVGVLRGRVDLVEEADPAQLAASVQGAVQRSAKLQSLFVRKDHHHRGIGRRLVEQFERACRQQGATVIRLQATLYAVPFYQAAGYKRSTGVRSCPIFDGTGFPYQPMRKVLG
ncbi:MAG: GNAT family N-acetyltransferase [Anaerolineae bacterium]|nr:GNAT family N-acetyltransferase [Anaerolineae bacterium]